VLTEAGADAVHTGEGEVALAFIEDILETLGATAEQSDRERARAHRELAGEAVIAGQGCAEVLIRARFRPVLRAWLQGRSVRFCGKLSACTRCARLAQR
jgi:hypothetical protein